ncbi:MAG: sugar transporter [Deltaproteobacteria bacterium]|nr:MAG: sugar transporter [Deltaproteobacteria bacterium]
MRIIFSGLTFALIWALLIQPAQADDNVLVGSRSVAAASSEQYMVGPGDVLLLTVWKDAALSRQVTVLPDGTISLPLIGQTMASNRTVKELEQEIRAKIAKYLPEPVLDISVQAVNSMIFYVIGKVRAPGRYATNGNVNVLQALAIAGGLDKHASEGNIKIYREEQYQTTIFSFDYDEVVDGEKLEQNIRLLRGDVVVVP